MIKPDKYTDLYRLRTAIFLFVYSAVALIFVWQIIQLFRVHGETPLELVAIILMIVPRFMGFIYFSYCGLIDVKRLERRRNVFLLSMAVFASYLFLTGGVAVYHYILNPDHLVVAKQFNVTFEFAEKTRIGLSRLAFTLNSFVLGAIFVYNIIRFRISGFKVENQLRWMCSFLIALGMANVLVVSFPLNPLVGFLAIFIALWTREKGAKLAFLQAILLALASAGLGSGIFLVRDFFTEEGIKQVIMLTMLISFVIGALSLLGYVITRKRFYSKLKGNSGSSR